MQNHHPFPGEEKDGSRQDEWEDAKETVLDLFQCEKKQLRTLSLSEFQTCLRVVQKFSYQKKNVRAFLRFEEEKAVLGRNLATGLAFLVVPKNHQVQGLTYTASGEDWYRDTLPKSPHSLGVLLLESGQDTSIFGLQQSAGKFGVANQKCETMWNEYPTWKLI